MIPKDYWIAFTDNLIVVAEIQKYQVNDGIFIFDCTERSSVPDMYFMFESVDNKYMWLSMSADDFIFDASASQDDTVCGISIIANTENFFILGNSFMKGYYSIFDMTDSALGFIPHYTSTKESIFEGKPPTRSLS